ncbi:SulP family inorganic anion transporter [Phyllobacterium endophyticum]|uniref:SulP family inorganic anion transporter n=1 Tax=Phyllobacterium endophyticum TaxID=1149773 RepID=UPI0011C782D3|nr:SulP family inorganic anion transporter [Phyllobacterium endophyticum]TXR46316.1 SulP family inorganic anion transporter [Phyllobacterium endophyticum]
MILSIPGFRGMRGYQAGWLPNDISAGLAVAAVGLPSAIAYPAIVGLPLATGLYASIAAPIGYALFGPSRILIVGPDAATMTVLAAAVTSILNSLPADAPVDRTTIASLIALCVGGICLAARLLRLGVVATFLSRPILVGFFAGVSVSIIVGQIGRLTAVKIQSDGLIAPFLELISKWATIHWPSLLLGLSMFFLLQIVRASRLPVPGPVIVVVVSAILSALFNFQQMGIAVVGDVPFALPTVSLPSTTGLPLDQIVLGAAAVFLVSLGSGIVAARSFASRTGETVDANQELVGLGAGNIASGLLGAFPVSVSDSRTAICLSAGGKSQLAGVVSAAALIATLLYFNDILRILPIPALGAILVAAALSLIDVAELKRIWRISRAEFVFALITMWGAISFGVLAGVVIAIAATLVYLLHKMMFPRDALLGRIPGHDGFYKLHRFPEAVPIPGFALCMIQGSVLFFNADYVRERIRTIAASLPVKTRWLVLDAGAIAQIDSTAVAMLDDVRADLATNGITLGVAELHAEVKAMLHRSGALARIGPQYVFEDAEDAIRGFTIWQNKQSSTSDAGRTVP